MVRHLLAYTILLYLAVFLAPARAWSETKLSTEIHPNFGTTDDVFIFSVVITDPPDGEPKPLITGGKDFELALIGPSKSISIVNSRINQTVTYNYQLMPKKEGILMTPGAELEVGSGTLKALPLPVSIKGTRSQEAKAGEAENREYFIRQRFDGGSQVYVGQQLIHYIEIYTRSNIIDPQLGDLKIPGFYNEPFGQQENSRRFINGVPFTVSVLRRALYPQAPGHLEISPRELKAKVRSRASGARSPFGGLDPFNSDLFDDFFGRVILKPITLRSNTLEAIIAPTPTPPATLPRLGMAAPPVGRTEIYTSYDSSEIKFGETKTVEVTISSTGLINSLKGPLFKSSPSLKIYEESPQTTNEFDGSRLISKRTFKISLLPMSGDKVEIEPLRLGFFDPELGTFSVAEGEPIRFLVSGTPKISTSEPAQTGIEVETEQPPPPSQQRSDGLKYQEPTIIERLSERVSATLVAWFVFALISAAGATLLGLRLRSLLLKRKALFSHLEAADTPSKLSLVIRGAIRARYPGLTVEFSRAELRALVSDPNMLYQLERVLDGFDEALYGGSHRELRELKELSKRCLELLN